MVKGFKVTHHSAETAFEFMKTRMYAGIDLSVALLSVGFIVGIRIASFIFLGGIIGYGILVPLYGYLHWLARICIFGKGFETLWLEQVRYVALAPWLLVEFTHFGA